MKIHQFNVNDSKVKPYPLCVGNISKYFTVDNKTGLNRFVYDFSLSYETIDVSGIKDIHKYLMKNAILYKCLDFIKQIMFIGLVLVLLFFDGSLAMKCISMNSHLCFVRATVVKLNLDELHYYPFVISINRCGGNCNTIEDPFGGICIRNKMEDVKLKVKLKVFNMTKGINESKILAKHIIRCELDGRKCNSRQKWNNGKCHCECKTSRI